MKDLIDINTIIENVPDKTQDKNTTSHKFKHDLFNFFNELDINFCVEIGTSNGWTTGILSRVCNNVITIDNDMNNLERAMQHNTDYDNIEYMHGDVYNSDWGLEYNIDLAFIDCVHDYIHVDNDIKNSIKYSSANMYLVFDDYGLVNEVKRAADDWIETKKIQFVAHIGDSAGIKYPHRNDAILYDSEGIICKYTKN